MITDEYYWDRANGTRMGHYLTQVEGQFISHSLAHYPTVKTILDIGGGSGRFAIPLHRQGYRVLVAEADHVPLGKITPRMPDLPCIRISPTAQKLAIASQSIDCVLCIEVPALVDHATWFFAECHRVLRKEGLVIFTAHNGWSYKSLAKKFVRRDKQFYSASLLYTHKRLQHARFLPVWEQGFNWLPATRASNNGLIPLAAYLEQRFPILSTHLVWLSPWVLILAQKLKED